VATNDPKTKELVTDPATPPASTDGPDESLKGYIDERIAEAVKNLTPAGSTAPKSPVKVDLAEQLRTELAKIDDERASKAKAAETETTIAELKESVKNLAEAPPVEVGRLTRLLWGK
jgi:hypothetical protein